MSFEYLSAARARCRAEREYVRNERDAFVEFRQRVGDVDTATVAAGGAAGDGSVLARHCSRSTGTGGVGLRRVIKAYRKTVMSVPHYETEYGDTLTESLTEEFSQDAAVAITFGDELLPGIKSAVLTQSDRAAEARNSMIEAIDRELAALAEVESTLASIDRERRVLIEHLDEASGWSSFDATKDVWTRFRDLEARCESVAADRQEQLRNPSFSLSNGLPSIYEYLYGTMPATSHPVMSQIAVLVDRIHDERARVERKIATID